MNIDNEEMRVIKSKLECVKELAYYLTSDYINAFKTAPIPQNVLGEYIAFDWNWITELSHSLYENNVFDSKILSQIVEINNRFDKVTNNSPDYDARIWSSYSFSSHPFWKEQKKLAEQLLTDLGSISIPA